MLLGLSLCFSNIWNWNCWKLCFLQTSWAFLTGFGWDFSALSCLLWQFLEHHSGLVSPHFRNVWVPRLPWPQAELFCPHTAFLGGFFVVFFPSFGGRSPNKCSYTFHLKLRCLCRQAEQSRAPLALELQKWGLQKFICGALGRERGAEQPNSVFLPVLTYSGEKRCTCVSMWGHHNNPSPFLKVIFPGFLPLQLQQVSSLGLSLLVLIGFNISKLPSHSWWFSSQHQVV